MKTILVVDDDPEARELCAEVLELMHHRVLRARDGREALEIARERRPDLVVTDCQMPRMSGVELCRRLVQDEELRDVPVIMYSASPDPHAPGVRRFLSKSAEVADLEEAVSRTLSEVPAGSARVSQPDPGRLVPIDSGSASRSCRVPWCG